MFICVNVVVLRWLWSALIVDYLWFMKTWFHCAWILRASFIFLKKNCAFPYRIVDLLLCFKISTLFSWMEERRLRVHENGVLRNLLGPNREEITEGWRKLHTEVLHDSALNQVLLNWSKQGGRYGGACSSYGEGEKCICAVEVETAWSSLLASSRHREEDDIKKYKLVFITKPMHNCFIL